MKYDFDQVIDRKNTNSYKWDCMSLVFPDQNDLLPMWVADMDFVCADEIVEAVTRRAAHPIYGYSNAGSDFGGPAARWVNKRHGWKISSSNVSFCHGVVPALAACITALTQKDDCIVIQQPVYYPFSDIIQKNERTLISNDLFYSDQTQRWEIDFDDLEEKLRDASIFILCNPHNPVCRAFTEEELKKIGELCIKYDVTILSDEIHSDLVYRHAKHIPIASLSQEISNQTITMISPSKAFNIAGLQVACVISENKELLDLYNFEMEKSMHIMNLFGIVAYETAYDKCEDYIEELVDYLWANYIFMDDYIKKEMPLLHCQKPEATYLIWIDCSELGLKKEDVYDFFINQAGVAVDIGSWFGGGGEAYARLNIATPKIILIQVLDRLKEAYDLHLEKIK